MGLAAPKVRNRISNDPQNTTWANNTSRFGHRILTSQGWTPGSTLGAKDASHAEHYTAASASHIRVLLKDDTLGLGAKRGSERAENFGLAGLESILGRLNGREEDVKREEARREEVERRGWVARKYGYMNFVSGGFLVGDKIEKGVRRIGQEVKKVEEAEKESDREKKSKKRKRNGDADDDDGTKTKEEDAEGETRSLKRKKKNLDLRNEASKDSAEEAKEKSKKDKKDKKKKRSKSSDSSTTGSEEPLSEKAKRKAEKRARKEEKKLKKALKKAAKEASRSTKSAPDSPADSSSSEEEEPKAAVAASAPVSVPTSGTSTPSAMFGSGARHAVRQRYIRQKKMASMDPQALKEIFMIKTPA